MRVQTRRALAYHEAGHALLRLHLGLDIKEVSIVYDEETKSRGHVTGELPQDKHIKELGNHLLASLVLLVEEGMIRVAGPEAKELITGRKPGKWAHRDYRVDLWSEEGKKMGPEEREAFLHWIVERVKPLLNSKRHYLDAIAEALFQHKELSGGEIQDIMSKVEARPGEGRPE